MSLTEAGHSHPVASIEPEALRRGVTCLESSKLVAEHGPQGGPSLAKPTCFRLSDCTGGRPGDVTSSVLAQPVWSGKESGCVGTYRTDPGGHDLPAPFNE